MLYLVTKAIFLYKLTDVIVLFQFTVTSLFVVQTYDLLGFTNENDTSVINGGFINQYVTEYYTLPIVNGVPTLPIIGNSYPLDTLTYPKQFALAVSIDPSKYLFLFSLQFEII